MRHTPLYPFQTEDVRRIHKEFDGVSLLASELGLGKTITALSYAWKYLPDDPPGPVVVLVPSHLKLHWKREAEKHLGIRAEILSGQNPPPDKQPPLDPNQVFVINYEILVPPLWPKRAPLPADSWAAFLLALRPRLVIADEGHRLKNPYAACTRGARRLFRSAPRRLALTGTPLANKPTDLWSLLNLLRPDLYPSQFEFCQTYTHASRQWFGWVYRGARDLDVLHKNLVRTMMIRRRKADVLSDLPAVTTSVVDAEVDLGEYRRAEEDFLNWLEESHPGASRSAVKAEELSRMTRLRHLAAELKVPFACSWVEGLLEETGGKLLLGGLHYSVTEAVRDHFGRRAVLIDGRMNWREKQAAFDKFNLDPGCELCIGNIEAAGTGWSCTGTSDVALLEFPWRPGDVSQFIGRVHGIERGVPGAVAHARFLVAAGTIDEDMCGAIQRKGRWAAEAVDGDASLAALDIHDMVKASMKRRHGR